MDTKKLTYLWYENYYKKKETIEFNKWWLSFYGSIEDCIDKDMEDYIKEDAIQDYFIRKGFALAGWLARNTPNIIPIYNPNIDPR